MYLMTTSSRRIIDRISIHKSTGKENDTFVGVRIENSDIFFSYPVSFDLRTNNDYNLRKDIILVLQSLKLANTDFNKLNSNGAEGKENSNVINSYLRIILDFLNNGFYTNREKIYKTNQRGKVSRKRTLRNQPIISNGNVIYNNIVVETKSNSDDLLLKIHKFCVRKSIILLGWLFNLNPNMIEEIHCDKNLFTQTIKKELEHTFDDMKKIRFRNILSVLTDSNADKQITADKCVYGVNNYDHVFECMINELFNGEDQKQFYPSSRWYVYKNSLFTAKDENKPLRPDTVIVDKNANIAYVLDAKNYIEGSLPTTDSIQKQITYGDFIKNNKIKGVIEVRSAFIIPYNRNFNNLGLDNTFEYYGYAKTDWRTNNQSHEIIHAFMIDMRYVLENWQTSDGRAITKQLIVGIEKAIQEIKNSNQ